MNDGRFKPGQSGNPGGRPRLLGIVGIKTAIAAQLHSSALNTNEILSRLYDMPRLVYAPQEQAFIWIVEAQTFGHNGLGREGFADGHPQNQANPAIDAPPSRDDRRVRPDRLGIIDGRCSRPNRDDGETVSL